MKQHGFKTPTYVNRPEPTQPADDPQFEGQHQGEEVRLMFRHHPVVMRHGLIYSFIPLLIGVLPTLFNPDLGFGWFFGGLGVGAAVGITIFFPYWVRWYYSVYLITTERILQIKQKGFFKREVDSLFHARIHGINYKIDGLQGFLLRFGTISILTEVGNFDIHFVPHPEKLHEQMLEAVRDHIGEDE